MCVIAEQHLKKETNEEEKEGAAEYGLCAEQSSVANSVYSAVAADEINRTQELRDTDTSIFM